MGLKGGKSGRGRERKRGKKKGKPLEGKERKEGGEREVFFIFYFLFYFLNFFFFLFFNLILREEGIIKMREIVRREGFRMEF